MPYPFSVCIYVICRYFLEIIFIDAAYVYAKGLYLLRQVLVTGLHFAGYFCSELGFFRECRTKVNQELDQQRCTCKIKLIKEFKRQACKNVD